MGKDLIIASTLAALGAGAWLWANLAGSGDMKTVDPGAEGATGVVNTEGTVGKGLANGSQGPSPATKGPTPRQTPSADAPSPTRGGTGPTGASVMTFEDLPAGMQPEAIQGYAASLREWLGTQEELGLEVLEPDCTEAPCVLPVLVPEGGSHAGPMGALIRHAEELSPEFTVVPMPQPGRAPAQMSVLWLPKDDPRLSSRIRSLAMRRVRMDNRLPGGLPPGAGVPVAPRRPAD